MSLISMLNRTIALTMVLCFLATSSGYPATAFAATTSSPTRLSQDLSKIVIPENYGVVDEVHVAQGTPNAHKVIIQIQDVHANHEVQQNIQHILAQFARETSGCEPIGMVAVEGAKGPIDTSLFRALPDENVRKATTHHFFKMGFLTGSETYAILASDSPVPLYGIEDDALYKKNLNAFHSVKGDGGLAMRAEKVLWLAHVLRKKQFSNELSEIWDYAQGHTEGKVTFTEYCVYLKTVAQAAGIDLKDYPQVKMVLEAIAQEKLVVYADMEKERATLIEQLRLRLSRQEMKELVSDSLQFRLGKMPSLRFHEKLMQWGKGKGIVGKGEAFKNLVGYLEILRLHSGFEGPKVHGQVERLVQDIKKRYMRDEDDEKLDQFLLDAQTLVQLSGLRMSRRDLRNYDDIKGRLEFGGTIRFLEERVLALAIDETARAALREIQDEGPWDLGDPQRFYELALARDEALLENTLRKMEQEKITTVAMVTGGFHTDGIKERLKAKGYSYVLVTPRVTQNTDERRYLHLMTNGHTDIPHLFAGDGHWLAVMLKSSNELIPTEQAEAFAKYVFVVAQAISQGQPLDQDAWIAGMADPGIRRAVREFRDTHDILVSDKELSIIAKVSKQVVATGRLQVKAGEISLEFMPKALPPAGPTASRASDAFTDKHVTTEEEADTETFLQGLAPTQWTTTLAQRDQGPIERLRVKMRELVSAAGLSAQAREELAGLGLSARLLGGKQVDNFFAEVFEVIDRVAENLSNGDSPGAIEIEGTTYQLEVHFVDGMPSRGATRVDEAARTITITLNNGNAPSIFHELQELYLRKSLLAQVQGQGPEAEDIAMHTAHTLTVLVQGLVVNGGDGIGRIASDIQPDMRDYFIQNPQSVSLARQNTDRAMEDILQKVQAGLLPIPAARIALDMSLEIGGYGMRVPSRLIDRTAFREWVQVVQKVILARQAPERALRQERLRKEVKRLAPQHLPLLVVLQEKTEAIEDVLLTSGYRVQDIEYQVALQDEDLIIQIVVRDERNHEHRPAYLRIQPDQQLRFVHQTVEAQALPMPVEELFWEFGRVLNDGETFYQSAISHPRAREERQPHLRPGIDRSPLVRQGREIARVLRDRFLVRRIATLRFPKAPQVFENLFRIPQDSRYHAEGPTLEYHLSLILLAIDLIARDTRPVEPYAPEIRFNELGDPRLKPLIEVLNRERPDSPAPEVIRSLINLARGLGPERLQELLLVHDMGKGERLQLRSSDDPLAFFAAAAPLSSADRGAILLEALHPNVKKREAGEIEQIAQQIRTVEDYFQALNSLPEQDRRLMADEIGSVSLSVEGAMRLLGVDSAETTRDEAARRGLDIISYLGHDDATVRILEAMTARGQLEPLQGQRLSRIIGQYGRIHFEKIDVPQILRLLGDDRSGLIAIGVVANEREGLELLETLLIVHFFDHLASIVQDRGGPVLDETARLFVSLQNFRRIRAVERAYVQAGGKAEELRNSDPDFKKLLKQQSAITDEQMQEMAMRRRATLLAPAVPLSPQESTRLINTLRRVQPGVLALRDRTGRTLEQRLQQENANQLPRVIPQDFGGILRGQLPGVLDIVLRALSDIVTERQIVQLQEGAIPKVKTKIVEPKTALAQVLRSVLGDVVGPNDVTQLAQLQNELLEAVEVSSDGRLVIKEGIDSVAGIPIEAIAPRLRNLSLDEVAIVVDMGIEPLRNAIVAASIRELIAANQRAFPELFRLLEETRDIVDPESAALIEAIEGNPDVARFLTRQLQEDVGGEIREILRDPAAFTEFASFVLEGFRRVAAIEEVNSWEIDTATFVGDGVNITPRMQIYLSVIEAVRKEAEQAGHANFGIALIDYFQVQAGSPVDEVLDELTGDIIVVKGREVVPEHDGREVSRDDALLHRVGPRIRQTMLSIARDRGKDFHKPIMRYAATTLENYFTLIDLRDFSSLLISAMHGDDLEVLQLTPHMRDMLEGIGVNTISQDLLRLLPRITRSRQFLHDQERALAATAHSA